MLAFNKTQVSNLGPIGPLVVDFIFEQSNRRRTLYVVWWVVTGAYCGGEEGILENKLVCAL